MANKLPLEEMLLKYDEDPGKIKLAKYAGKVVASEIKQGCVTVGTDTYYVSNNFPDGSVISINQVETRSRDLTEPLLMRDVLKYGSNDLTAVPFRSRHELLDLLCTSFPDEYGFKLFGGRCVAPHVFVALPITFSLAYKCQDDRLLGVTVYPSTEPGNGEDALRMNVEDDVDGINRWPPVLDESRRVMSYKHMVQACIRKMGGKWKDVYLKKHTPGQLPFSADDLMQQGLMEVTIAIRKYNGNHSSKAKESTFVYRHLWNRFGHIAHKYSKKSRGYGVQIMRDFIDEDGNVTTPYDMNISGRPGFYDADGE